MTARRKIGPMEAAVKRSIKALEDEIDAADQAMIELALTLARRLDHVNAEGDDESIQKSMWLAPHLANILKNLGISPAGRKGAGLPTTKLKPVGRLAELRAKRAEWEAARAWEYKPGQTPGQVTDDAAQEPPAG